MLDFYTPTGYKVRCYAGDTVYVSDANDRVVAVHTPRHGDVIYTTYPPYLNVEREEALEYGKQYLRYRESIQQE